MGAADDFANQRHRAKLEALGLGAAGIVAMAFGLWAIQQPNLTTPMVWVITLVIFGPVMVFIALIGYYSFLEEHEAEGPGQDQSPHPFH